MRKFSTGILSLDTHLGGGFPEGSVIVLFEDPGAGADVFLNHFVIDGIKKNEKILYISTNDTAEEVKFNLKRFDNIELNNLEILDFMTPKILIAIGNGNAREFIKKVSSDPYKAVLEKIQSERYDRIAFNSLSEFLEHYDRASIIRLIDLFSVVSKRNRSVTLISVTRGMFEPSFETAIKHYADGVIELTIREAENEVQRRLKIVKLKKMLIPKSILRYDITEKGIRMESVMRVL